jgi:hypothetical protein
MRKTTSRFSWLRSKPVDGVRNGVFTGFLIIRYRYTIRTGQNITLTIFHTRKHNHAMDIICELKELPNSLRLEGYLSLRLSKNRVSVGAATASTEWYTSATRGYKYWILG